jgi:hypothetical protein
VQGCGFAYWYGSSIFFKLRIRIQFQIQGFDDQKLKKKFYINFFLSKMEIYLSLGLPKGRPSYKRSLQPPQESIQHFKTCKFVTFFYFCGSFSALLDPDPDPATQISAAPYGSGSTTQNLWHHPPLPISGTDKIAVICWTNHLAMDKLIWVTTDISSHLHHSSAISRSGPDNHSFHVEKIVSLHISVSDPDPDWIRIQAGQKGSVGLKASPGVWVFFVGGL